VEKWPGTSSGFTFMTWFRIESFARPEYEEKKTFRPRLFSLADQTGAVAEYFFSSGSFFATTSVGGIGQTAEFSGLKFERERWYFVTVVHSAKKRSGSGEVTVYVDGLQQSSTAKLDLPINSSGFTLSVGSSAFPKSGEVTSLWGQLTSVYIFDEIFSEVQAQAAYDLGFDYTSQFFPDPDLYPKARALFDGVVHTKLVVDFNAKATQENICFDLSQNRSGASKENGQLTYVVKSVSSKLRDIVHTQGGLKSLFPLILQTDGVQTGQDTVNLPLTTLQLFTALLNASLRNQDDLFSEYVHTPPPPHTLTLISLLPTGTAWR